MSSRKSKRIRKNLYLSENVVKQVEEQVLKSDGLLNESGIVDLALKHFYNLPLEQRSLIFRGIFEGGVAA